MVVDRLQRPLRDLRISVTDRCNFRCGYCMPKAVYDKNFHYLPHSSLLTFEEIVRLVGIATKLGVEKIRLTGGEPLLRKNIEVLIARLAELKTLQGTPLELTLTTNGALLEQKAKVLKDAGLTRLTVSMDAMDSDVFARMNDVDFPLERVLKGLDAAQAVGFTKTKVNMVVQKGHNTDQLLPMLRFFLKRSERLRLIEFMDVGQTNDWSMDQVFSSAQMRELIQPEFVLTPLERMRPSDTAEPWQVLDPATGNSTELGFISSISQAFCGQCNRARLSTEGKLYLCLFASLGFDLRSLLRSGASDAVILQDMQEIWQGRSDRYSELRALGKQPQGKRIEMSYIGG